MSVLLRRRGPVAAILPRRRSVSVEPVITTDAGGESIDAPDDTEAGDLLVAICLQRNGSNLSLPGFTRIRQTKSVATTANFNGVVDVLQLLVEDPEESYEYSIATDRFRLWLARFDGFAHDAEDLVAGHNGGTKTTPSNFVTTTAIADGVAGGLFIYGAARGITSSANTTVEGNLGGANTVGGWGWIVLPSSGPTPTRTFTWPSNDDRIAWTQAVLNRAA